MDLSENKIIEYDNNEIKECRICFLTEIEEPNKLFINPCACSGTSKWVHLECLNRWRSEGTNPNSNTICSECKTPYNIIIAKNEKEEILFYRIENIFNFNIFFFMFTAFITLLVYCIDTLTDNFFIKLVGFGNIPNITENYQNTFVYPVFYFNITGFLMYNLFAIYFLINICKNVKQKKRYFCAVKSKFITFIFLNLLFLPLYQIGICLDSLDFVVYFFTTKMYFINMIGKSLLKKSNNIILNINLEIHQEDTILPYNNEVLSDEYDADTESSEEIELFTLELDENSESNMETSLLTDNFV